MQKDISVRHEFGKYPAKESTHVEYLSENHHSRASNHERPSNLALNPYVRYLMRSEAFNMIEHKLRA